VTLPILSINNGTNDARLHLNTSTIQAGFSHDYAKNLYSLSSSKQQNSPPSFLTLFFNLAVWWKKSSSKEHFLSRKVLAFKKMIIRL
jgi:hypothetical protein